MCMAIFQPKDKIVSKEYCDSFAKSNDDGFGFAFVDNSNKLIINKTIIYNDFYKEYVSCCKQYGSKSPFLIHFRMGTSGLDNQDNCHPFYVDDNLCVIHNGVFSEFNGDKNLSDTNIFVRDVLKDIGQDIFTNSAMQALIEDYIGTWNKLVFMNNKKEYIIFNEKEGKWEEGIW